MKEMKKCAGTWSTSCITEGPYYWEAFGDIKTSASDMLVIFSLSNTEETVKTVWEEVEANADFEINSFFFKITMQM